MWLTFLIIIVALFFIKASAVRKGFIQRTQEIKESGRLCDYTKLCTNGIKTIFYIKVNKEVAASVFVNSSIWVNLETL